MSSPEDMVDVRDMVDDVQSAIDFTPPISASRARPPRSPTSPAAACSSCCWPGRKARRACRCPTAASPGRAAGTDIDFIVPDIAVEVARLRAEGVPFRNEIITGPGGKQILVEDPAGNVVELFEPAASSQPGQP